jgi:predicted Zn finger-like uncharacterized protein
MKTRCPKCHTVFRITQEQIGAHAGKVRCGQCRTVFNALNDLIGERRIPAAASAPAAKPRPEPMFVDASPRTITEFHAPPRKEVPADPLLPRFGDSPAPARPGGIPARPSAFSRKEALSAPSDARIDDDLDDGIEFDSFEPQVKDLSEDIRIGPASVAEEEGFADSPGDLASDPGIDPIIPRVSADMPGYSKWAEGVMVPPLEIAAEKSPRWPFRLAAAALVLTLAGQSLFHFRGELAIAMPSLRPALETMSLALGDPLPLPRHADLVSIEASDLQTDPARGNLLVFNATLRNRAHYGQAWPSLILSLTDTQNTEIARRVFTPQDYLPAKNAANPVFSGDSDFAVRLWIEAVNLAAVGYKLSFFYP